MTHSVRVIVYLDVVGDPLNEVGGVLVLDVKHLLVNLLH